MLDAISNPKDIIKRIHELNQPGFAVTDHNGCSGLVDTYLEVEKFNKKHETNLKLLFGAELYFVTDVTIKESGYSHILFIAKDNEGLKNLYRLTSEAHKHFYVKSRCDLDMIKKYSKGLICTSACMGGWLKRDDADDLTKAFKDIFGDDLYLELHTYRHPEQRVHNQKVLDMANKYNIKTIACTDSHYVNKEDYVLHKQLRGLQANDEDKYYQFNDFYLMEESEVKQRLSYLDESVVNTSVDNTMEIFNKCNVTIKFDERYYPHFVKDGDVKELFLSELRKGYVANKHWRKTPEYKRELDKRLTEVEIPGLTKVGYLEYMLITADIINAAKKKGIPVGHGRGSVGGCECAHLLGITTLDAITNDLYFERFANPDRISPADIDIDVSQRRRGEVIDYIKEKYGYVYQCRTFNFFAARGALQRASKALGYEPDLAKEWSKKIAKPEEEEGSEEEFTDIETEWLFLDTLKNIAPSDVIELAKKFVGIMSGFGKHASCVIVSDRDIRDYCSLEMQKDSTTKKQIAVAACNFKHLEHMGFLKEDILGLRTLDVVHDCIELTGKHIDTGTLPWEDDKTLELLRAGKTLGVFQMKSYGMVKTLKSMQPTSFIDLIAVVALYRPACINTGILDEYLRRRKGGQFTYPDERLKTVLGDTFGLMLFQEQIMAVCRTIGGYSMAEADTVRRAIGKKDHELMDEITGNFVERAVKNGTDEQVAREILGQIIASASYGFNKAHSQNYAFLSWITAYLKAHYPLEFYIASINSENGNHEKVVPFINEMQERGITILSPDLRYSNNDWTLEDGKARMGLRHIKGIGDIDRPSAYTFDEIYQMYNKKQLESLISAGALDFLGDRKHLFGIIEDYKSYVKRLETINSKIVLYTERSKEINEQLPFITVTKERASMQKKALQADKKVAEWTDKKNTLPKPSIEQYDKTFDEKKAQYDVLGVFLDNPLVGYDTSLANGVSVIPVAVQAFNESKDRKGHRMARVIAHTGKQYMMFYRNFRELKVGGRYYLGVRDNIINSVQKLERIS